MVKKSKVRINKLKQILQYNKLITRICGLIILIIAIMFLAYLGYFFSQNGFTMEGILGGRADTKTQAEMEAELQELMEDGMFRIKINQRPSMNIDTNATGITVQNSVENTFAKRIVYRSEGGAKIYETRVLYPGEQELSAVFPGKWNKGQYKLLAEVFATEVESGEEFLVTELEVVLTVKEN